MGNIEASREVRNICKNLINNPSSLGNIKTSCRKVLHIIDRLELFPPKGSRVFDLSQEPFDSSNTTYSTCHSLSQGNELTLVSKETRGDNNIFQMLIGKAAVFRDYDNYATVPLLSLENNGDWKREMIVKNDETSYNTLHEKTFYSSSLRRSRVPGMENIVDENLRFVEVLEKKDVVD